MPRVAISYRRTDSDAITGRIFDRLVARYGSESVFRDIDSMPAGVDFRHHINKIVSQSDVVLAIVGPRWVGSSRNGQRRITQEGDPVRIEIETALSADVPVIPILVGRARMPAVSLLPASLTDFVYRNALTVDSGEDFDHHIRRLVSAIDKLLTQSDRVGFIPHSLPAAGGAGAENAIKPRYREDRSSTGDQGDLLPPGCVLGGKYEVERLLGRGGFSATYLAWDANLRVRIAIKEFFPRQLATRVSGGSQVHPYTSSQDTFSIGLDQFLRPDMIKGAILERQSERIRPSDLDPVAEPTACSQSSCRFDEVGRQIDRRHATTAFGCEIARRAAKAATNFK